MTSTAGKLARRVFFTQPVEGAFELGAGEVRVGDDAVRPLERRGVLFANDRPVEGNVSDDLQSIPVWAEESQIVLEQPEVVQDQDDAGWMSSISRFAWNAAKTSPPFGLVG